MAFFLLRRAENCLAQAHPIGAKLALNLEPVQSQGNLKALEKILPEQHAVTLLHIEKLDREDIGRAAQLVKCEYQQTGISLAPPPFCNRPEALEFDGASVPDDTEDVQIRMLGNELAGDGRAVENDCFQIISRGSFQAFYKFVESGFHISEYLELQGLAQGCSSAPNAAQQRTLPTAARTAASK